MNMYMEQCKLPHELRFEVREFLNAIGKKLRARALQREEADLLGDLSFGLRAKLAHAINHFYLQTVPFLNSFLDGSFTSRLCMAMSSSYVSAGEDITRTGDWSDAMYFIVSGSVELVKIEIVSIPRGIQT